MPVVTQTTLVTSAGVDSKVTTAVAAQLGTGGSVPRRFTAASITAMQALSDAVKGDLCARTDFTPNRVYQLVGVYSVSTDWVDITSPSSSLALGLTSTTAKPGDWVPAVAEVTGLTAALAGKAPSSHTHTIDALPAGTVVASTAAARPTARTDIPVLWLTATDPGAAAVDGVDVWVAAP